MASGLKNILFGGKGTGSMLGDLGLTALRLSTGLLLALGHGFSKVYAENRLGPDKGLVNMVSDLGFPAPTAFAWAAALTEFVGGLLIAAGLLTRPAAAALAFNMIVAAFMQHGGDPWTAGPGQASKEMALLYLAPAILLLLVGAGRVSADHVIAGCGGGCKSSRGAE